MIGVQLPANSPAACAADRRKRERRRCAAAAQAGKTSRRLPEQSGALLSSRLGSIRESQSMNTKTKPPRLAAAARRNGSLAGLDRDFIDDLVTGNRTLTTTAWSMPTATSAPATPQPQPLPDVARGGARSVSLRTSRSSIWTANCHRGRIRAALFGALHPRRNLKARPDVKAWCTAIRRPWCRSPSPREAASAIAQCRLSGIRRAAVRNSQTCRQRDRPAGREDPELGKALAKPSASRPRSC